MNPTPDQEFARLHRQLRAQMDAGDSAAARKTVEAMLAVRPGDPDTLKMQIQLEQQLGRGIKRDLWWGVGLGGAFGAYAADGLATGPALGTIGICVGFGAAIAAGISGWRRGRRQVQIRR